MKNNKVIIITLVVVVIVATLYYVVSSRTSSSNTSRVGSEPSVQNALSTQTLTDRTVTYKITPKNLASSATTWDFDISLDTHTGSLDQDLVTLVRLVDDKGNVYKAVSWEGDQPGGHHREGMLKFYPIIPQPTFIEVNIKTSGSTEKNSLRWDI